MKKTIQSTLVKLAIGITAVLLASSCTKKAEESSSAYSAYREDAVILGHFDIEGLRSSELSSSLKDTLPVSSDDLPDFGIEEEDVRSLSFSISNLNPATDEEPLFTVLVHVSKVVTLEQLVQFIDQKNAESEEEDQLSYERTNIEGVDALLVDLEERDLELVVTVLPVDQESFLVMASPEVFGDLVHKRNSSSQPEFAKKSSQHLSHKQHGSIVIKITPEMKESLREVSENMKSSPGPMGFSMPVGIANNLPNLNSVNIGVSATDKLAFELQGVLENKEQAAELSSGLSSILMMAQAMIGMALSDPSSEVPVTPAFSQETKENATSIVITLTKK